MDSPPTAPTPSSPDPLRQRAIDALRAAWETHHSDGHVRLALHPDAAPIAPSAAAADALTQPEHLRARVAADPDQLRALAALASMDLPARAESARREALLNGLGDVEAGLYRLVASGLVVLIPEPGQRGWNLADELTTRRFLQRELLLPAPVLALILHHIDLSAPPPAASHAPPAPDPDLLLPSLTAEQLELNLLHLASALNGDALLLNKDGSPNRRSLARFLRGLTLDPANPPYGPSAPHPDAATPALHTEHATFLLALGLQLDLLTLDDPRTLTANPDGIAAHFAASAEHRDAALLRALRTCARWDEIDALTALRDDRSPRSNDARTSITLDQPGIAAARSQTLDDLRKLDLDGWLRLDALIDLLVALDRGYLSRALPPTTPPTRFLRALLTHVLPWIGAAQLASYTGAGRSDLALRLTPRGRRMLRLDPPAPTAPNQGPPLFVQPNFEITVFLAAASLQDLHTLYRVGTRASLTEHTATFQLTAETVQRGYGQGLDADSLIAFLNQRSRVPTPDAVAFTLRDWERVQRKITLYADGALLQHPDPDRFDLVLGTLAHYWPDTNPPVVPLGATAAFLPTLDPADLGRAIPDGQLHLIDYTQPPPPCLAPAQDLTFDVLPTGLDLVTRAELPLLLDPIDDPDPDLALQWRLNPDKLRARWPEHTAQHTLDFLTPRLGQRLTADLELRILALLTDDTHAYVHTEATLLRVSSPEVCDKLLELPAVVNSLLARLGPTTLLVEDAAAEPLHALLERLGLDG